MATDHDVVEHRHVAEQRQVLEGAADPEVGSALVRRRVTSFHFEVMRPSCGMYRPEMQFSIDVLPAPFGPMMENNSPSARRSSRVVASADATKAQRHLAYVENNRVLARHDVSALPMATMIAPDPVFLIALHIVGRAAPVVVDVNIQPSRAFGYAVQRPRNQSLDTRNHCAFVENLVPAAVVVQRSKRHRTVSERPRNRVREQTVVDRLPPRVPCPGRRRRAAVGAQCWWL